MNLNKQPQLELLLAKYKSIILGETMSSLRRHPEACLEPDDIVQDIMLEICKAKELIFKADNPGAYIRQIAKRKAYKSIKEALNFPVTLGLPVNQ